MVYIHEDVWWNMIQQKSTILSNFFRKCCIQTFCNDLVKIQNICCYTTTAFTLQKLWILLCLTDSLIWLLRILFQIWRMHNLPRFHKYFDMINDAMYTIEILQRPFMWMKSFVSGVSVDISPWGRVGILAKSCFLIISTDWNNLYFFFYFLYNIISLHFFSWFSGR